MIQIHYDHDRDSQKKGLYSKTSLSVGALGAHGHWFEEGRRFFSDGS